MPRTLFECDPTAYYHVTNRSINRDWFSMNLKDVWNIFCGELYFIKHAFDIKIYAFVLMNNHYHLLVSSPKCNLSEAISFFQSQSARTVVKRQNRINHLWAHRFKRTKIDNLHYFLNTYKYIYQNPVRAGVVRHCEDYRYSTLNGMLGASYLLIPIEEDFIFFDVFEKNYFSWINELPPKEYSDSMKKALRRSVFTLPKVNKRPNDLETEVL